MALAEVAMGDAADGASATIGRIAAITGEVRSITDEKIGAIQGITNRLRILALNALIESARAGDAGRGFTIVAQEVKSVSTEVESVAGSLQEELAGSIVQLKDMIERMAAEAQAERLIDLALNAIEIIDRNLYERTCDVRWWATDSAVVACAASPTDDAVSFASHRLGVILSAYTVYLDLWLCSLDGRVIASGRPDRYAVRGRDVSQEPWFRKARELASGDEYGVADIALCPALGNAMVATYTASVREDGRADGRPLGVLAIHFDWGPQADSVVKGVRFTGDEKRRSRALLVDARGRVIAASDGRGLLTETVSLGQSKEERGAFRRSDGTLVAFHRTPGYETYEGLGWSGVILQAP